MKTTHTPDLRYPWTAKREYGNYGQWAIYGKPHVDGSDLSPIATVAQCYENDDLIAKRMAAAPAMYEALKAIICPDNDRKIEWDSESNYYIARIEGGELKRARAALKLADGE